MPINPEYIHVNVAGVEMWDSPNYSHTSGDVVISGINGTADFPSGFTAATAATYNAIGAKVVYNFNFYKNATNRDRARAEITSIYNIDDTDIFVNAKVTPNVVNNIANTSETYTSRANEGIELKIIGTLVNYDFTTVPTVNYTDLYGVTRTATTTVTTNGNTKTATAILDFVNFNTNIVVNGVYAEIQPEPVNVDLTQQNCSVSGIPQTVYTNSVLNLTATANNNYEFNTPPQLTYTDENGFLQAYNFTVAANKLTATLQLDLGTLNLTDVSTIYISADADAITPQIEKYGTINVYKVTENDLKEFAKQRFFKLENTAQSYFEMIDLGNFVHSVKRLYCNVGETTPETLKCGNYDTAINVQTPLNDNITLNCGTVTIPHKNNNVTDFNSEIKLFLPFYGFYSLPSDYVGKTIAVQYVVNIITTNTVIKISYNNIIIDCLECNLSNDIVYKTNAENFNNVPEFNLQILKGLTPYLILKYYNSENNKIYNNDCLRGVLNTFLGYLQITELTNFNNSTITENEKNLLFSILENGVIILQS